VHGPSGTKSRQRAGSAARIKRTTRVEGSSTRPGSRISSVFHPLHPALRVGWLAARQETGQARWLSGNAVEREGFARGSLSSHRMCARRGPCHRRDRCRCVVDSGAIGCGVGRLRDDTDGQHRRNGRTRLTRTRDSCPRGPVQDPARRADHRAAATDGGLCIAPILSVPPESTTNRQRIGHGPEPRRGSRAHGPRAVDSKRVISRRNRVPVSFDSSTGTWLALALPRHEPARRPTRAGTDSFQR
jgi:hypothetical protein